MDKLIYELLRGSKAAAAQLISIVENNEASARYFMKEVKPYTGKARLIGITGTPGSGKSTLINTLTGVLRKKKKKVGVIAIDPTSPLTGGALLGDRIRMHSHFRDSGVFIRSMATRKGTGGLSQTAGDAAAILDAFGMDIVFIETTGVGQNETAIRNFANIVVVVITPNLGDEIQMMKAGLMEIGDIFVVNKGDLPIAERKAQEIEDILRLLPSGRGRPPVVITTAGEEVGIKRLLEELEKAGNVLVTDDVKEFKRTKKLDRK